MISKISSLLHIRPNETRNATLLIGIMLFSAAGYSLGGTGIEALYFARYGTDFLPYLYMGLGFLSLVTTLTITGLLGRVKRERMYVLVPLTAVGFILVAWGLLFSHNPLIYPALWLGKESLNTIVSMIGWNTASATCDTRQAKRLYPLFNAARILGSVLGGLSTGALVHWIGAQNLVLVWAASMFATFIFARLLMRQNSIAEPSRKKSRVKRRAPSFFQEMQKGWHYVRKSELMLWISAASILFSILYFSIALPFSKSATTNYPNENELAAFLGLFNGLSTAAAFLTSLLLANRLFARFGIMSMILVFPVIYLVGFGVLIPFNIFAVIVAFRFAQTLWLSGVADSAWQTMFSVVPPEKSDQVNAFLNGVPEQAGVFLAGTILLIGEQSFTPQQLYLIGFVTAIAATLIIWRASFAYRRALVSTLREGRPTLFDQPLGTSTDATTINILIGQLRHPDPLARRIAADLLAETPRADALTPSLQDDDVDVRVAALKGLTHSPAAASSILPLLSDPEPAARAQAIRTLRAFSVEQNAILSQPEQISNLLYNDPSPFVQIEAALTLLKLGGHFEARDRLRHLAVFGGVDERKAALNAMAEWGDREAFVFIENELHDLEAPSAIRRAAILALAACGRDSIPALAAALADDEPTVREAASLMLAQLGQDAVPSLLSALEDRSREDGALTALAHLQITSHAHKLKEYAARHIESALRYDDLADHLPRENDRLILLGESIHACAVRDGIQALRALAILSDRESIQVAIENLRSREATQRANALETLESVRESRMIRPLLRVWESLDPSLFHSGYAPEKILPLLGDPDAWIRACAAFATRDQPEAHPALETLAQSDPLIRDFLNQGEPMDTRIALPIMERVLLLRRVPLLADLTPSDLQRVASLATEHHIDADEVLFEEGDPGEEMFVVVHGRVRIMVRKDDVEKEFTRRGVGEVIGEMSLISGEPRAASVIAADETHLLCLDRKNFEGLLRERPEVGLAVMRVLCARLKEATR